MRQKIKSTEMSQWESPCKPSAYYTRAVFIPETDEIVAIAALLNLAGRDIVTAEIFMHLCDFGWGLWEEELRYMNSKIGLHGTLPSWLISSFRGGMRTELVLCAYRMNPRHGQLIGDVASSFSRIQRLVLLENNLGCDGARGIAMALSREGCTITDVLLDKCQIGDAGAAAIAEAIRGRVVLTTGGNGRRVFPPLRLLQLEENLIRDAGALALADALRLNRVLSNLCVGGNYIGPAGLAALSAAFEERAYGSVMLHSRFFRTQQSPPQGCYDLVPQLRGWKLLSSTTNETAQLLSSRGNRQAHPRRNNRQQQYY